VAPAARLLVADLDDKRAALLCKHLAAQGFHPQHIGVPLTIHATVAQTSPDLLVLQASLQPLTALDLCAQLRDTGSSLPILVLADTNHFGERVAVLNAGADDVLPAPYALEELVARVLALLRRSRMGVNDAAGRELSHRDLTIDTDQRVVTRAGIAIKLTVKEYDLLLYLLRHKQQVLPRHQILTAVWGDSWVGDDNLLDVYIRYLRKKVERPDLEALIHTERGVGFMLK
jgi:two-component system response regulator MprA